MNRVPPLTRRMRVGSETSISTPGGSVRTLAGSAHRVRRGLVSSALLVPLSTAAVLAFALLAAPSDGFAQCAVCEGCNTDADCGSGYVCRDVGAPANTICTQLCTTGSCPGDSVCYTFTFGGNTEMICMNPDAGTLGNCPASYTCTDDNAACTGLGTDCSSGSGVCSQLEAFTCLTETDADGTTRSYCTCPCTSSNDCDGSACVDAGGSMLCQAGADPGLCAGVTCSNGETCDPGTGNCVSDPNDLCADVTCPNGAICSPATGTCIGGNQDAGMDMGTPADTATGADTSTTTADTSTTGSDTSATGTTGTPDAGMGDVAAPGTFFVTSVSPTMGSNDRDTLIQLAGGGFVEGMSVRVGVTSATTVTVASPTIATANVPAGIAPGVYDVIAQLPTGTVFTLPSAYQVTGDSTVPPTGGGDDDSGCCTQVSSRTHDLPTGALALLAGLGLATLWRRRRR